MGEGDRLGRDESKGVDEGVGGGERQGLGAGGAKGKGVHEGVGWG